ncbi:hypothetical protein HHK36_013059 [Tetracentron sinense]|uniref:Uncharacterized protein n=1 Tax=Tetracentron sinense TaxID=13715 RepID=A0A835DIS7_TETSI|nr:hypothetical protein HHK36_013059 [Tetracentron sinense]
MSGRSRAIKLFCPSLSKLVSLVAMEEQNLDLGSIARTFGLDPVTLRLNGYFISRGVDLISSSVTWKSLLSFFSARGLSTGTNDAYALIVDGKLCKAGTKRAYNPSDGENGNYQTAELNGLDFKRKPQLEDVNLLKKKKINESNSGYDDGTPRTAEYNGLGFKRKPLLGDANLINKKKMKETNSERILNSEEKTIDADNAKVIEWEDFEQELARLWSLSSALKKAKEKKHSLQHNIESLIQVSAESLSRSNELEEMRQKLEARKLVMGNMLMNSKVVADDVKTQEEHPKVAIRSLLLAGKALSVASKQLQWIVIEVNIGFFGGILAVRADHPWIIREIRRMSDWIGTGSFVLG